MRVLVTGANGFIGRNLRQRLAERDIETVSVTSADTVGDLPERLEGVDFVVHLAGANRPADPAEFQTVNQGLTEALCAAVARQSAATSRPILVASTSGSARVSPGNARSN